MNVTAIVLAAGKSTRMGRNKLLLPWGETTVIEHVVATLRKGGVEEVVVVAGHEADRIRAALKESQVRLFENSAFDLGLGSSIAVGVRAAPAADGYLIVLSDMPYMPPELVAAVVAAGSPGTIVVPQSGMRRGQPVLFGSQFREELAALTGEKGARSIVDAHPGAVADIEWAEARAFDDIDTPADYGKRTG